MQRQLPGGFVVAGVVRESRDSHRSLTQEDPAGRQHPGLNLVDSASGQTYYQAVAASFALCDRQNSGSPGPQRAILPGPLCQRSLANGLTATQNIYKNAYAPHMGDWTDWPLLAIDAPVSAAAAAAFRPVHGL